MKKFFSVGSNSHVIALLLLFVLICFAFLTPTPCRAANLFEGYQFASKIELAAPLPSEMRVDDVKIQNTLRLSYFFINEEDLPFQKNISQGTVIWKTNNLTVQSANIIDNLGNNSMPLNESGLIMNRYDEVTIQPHSMYNLSLIMVLMQGASYFSPFQAWAFGTDIISEIPVEASITLPSNFSVPFYTAGAEYSKDQYYKVLTWRNTPLQPTLNITAIFLPFPYNPETKSFTFKMDISSIFPVPTDVKATTTQEFESLSEYNGLTVPQIFEMPVLFPASGKDIQVVSVFDTDGQYTKLDDRLSEPNNAYYGTYYVDNNSEVIVYPRAKLYEDHYDYDVSVTFDFGNEVPINVTFGQLWPYDCSSIFNVVNIKASGDWKLNMTQGTIVEFLLPQGTQPYQRSDYTLDTGEDGRYIVRFVNASLELTSGIWQIDFYIVRLYNFFWTEVASIVSLTALGIAMAFLRKRHLGNAARKMVSYVIPLFTGPGLIAAEYAIAGDWFWNILTKEKTLTVLLGFQMFLTAVVLFLAQKWKFEEQAP